MDANTTNLFYIKRAKPNSKGLVPIFQRVTVNVQRIEKSTGKYINLELWSAEGMKMKGKTDQIIIWTSCLTKFPKQKKI